MLTFAKTALLFIALFPLTAFLQDQAAPGEIPEYTSDARLKVPENYREWIYLSSGFDMSYSKAAMAGMPDHHMFDNVFVNPAAYKAFQKTGTWPDKTMLVLEVRGAEGRGSINQKGNYQGTVMGLEVHVKDEAHFPGKWAFFGFDDGKTAKMIPTTADCYSCHAAHAAVDTTFVQFYPTLLPIAKSKQTLSAAYLKELPMPAQK
jgi:Cytochrome P460